MTELVALSPSDASLLRDMLRRERRKSQNTLPPANEDRPWDTHDCYVASVPKAEAPATGSGGIPPLGVTSGADAGVSCTLYETRWNESTHKVELVKMTDFEELVFNPDQHWVGIGRCILHRDKFGNYLAFNPTFNCIALTPVSGIPARAGVKLGVADCKLYYVDAGDLLEWKDVDGNSFEVTVYNLSTTAVAGSVFIQVKRESLSNCLLADWEEC
jgi:hypothetical protein